MTYWPLSTSTTAYVADAPPNLTGLDWLGQFRLLDRPIHAISNRVNSANFTALFTAEVFQGLDLCGQFRQQPCLWRTKNLNVLNKVES
ncbi:hypothetical protein ACTXT7_004379 [Hymenolepis weldensis]